MFYQETNNKYINLKDEQYIKEKYLSLYKQLKYKYHKTLNEKQFIKDYQHLSNYITNNNNYYISEIRKHIIELNNINGFPLDEYQSRVVLSNEQNSLVIAGAGAGKSTTIIGKIIYLVKYLHINPKDILCISFTNDSTINLKNNISKNYNLDIDIYTFHKLALTILKSQDNYQILPDILSKVIDDFFYNYIPHNKLLTKSLHIVLGNKYSNKDLLNLKKLIFTFINLFKSQNYSISYYIKIIKYNKYNIHIKEHIQNKYLILIIINIYLEYERLLKEEHSIDFNDMINLSIESIKKYGLNKQWQYIIIDEFQDTSLIKLNLIKEIINITNAKLLVVGDDFQSIYRFTGCNLSIFLNFKDFFPYTKYFYIINTYRNPQELINVAGRFIMQNKKQINKQLISFKHLEYPIKIYYHPNNINGLKKLLSYVKKYNFKDILILGRNNSDIYNYLDNTFTEHDNYFTYHDCQFRYLTIHKSKGLESDIVIIINMLDSITGMPSKMKSSRILKYVNNDTETYPYEEERRLFYVALTRTKNYCFILTKPNQESIFITEIKKYKKYIEILKNI